ncbi:MAG: EamA family transporter, partial [Proteocatella sp.]
MKKRDLMFAILVVLVWGANFTVIKLGLSNMPPMLLAALRYIFTAFPAIIFIKRPAVGWKYIVSYGLTVGVGQFSFLFYAIYIGMPAGISSVVLQSQVFFTLIFAFIMLKESLNKAQIGGLFIEMAGLYLIGRDISVNTVASIPFEAFILTLIAAAFWGISNIIIRYA